MEEKSFIQVLRSHYKEKDSAAVFHEMSNSVQSNTESELDFCLRVMSLRQRVMSLSREEECAFDETLVRKRFFQAIFTGLKHNNIRLELQNTLKLGVVTDEELLQEISQTASIEYERSTKMKSRVNVCEVAVSDEKSVQKNKKEKSENAILAEISKLNAKVSELSTVRDELLDVKKQLAENNARMNQQVNFGNNNGYRRTKRIFRCRNCERDGSNFCNHCFTCGGADHRKSDCPSG